MKLNLLKHPGLITVVSLFLIFLITYLPTINKKSHKPPGAYSKFISAYTGGEISRQSPVTIRFVDELVKLADLNTTFDNSLISFKPDVYGKIRWIDSRTIQFSPSYGFDENKVYEASVDLKRIIPGIPDSLAEFQFKFKTLKPIYKVRINNPQPIDPDNPHWQKIEGTINASDYQEFYRIKNAFSAFENGSSLSLKWKHQNNGTEFQFSIDNLLRKEKPSDIDIVWKDAYGDTSFIGTKHFTLPALETFSHISTKSESYPEQYIMLEFSDPLNPDQDLNGLIYIPDIDSRIQIDNNKVYLYPKKNITGNVEVNILAGIQNTKEKATIKKTSASITFYEKYPQIKECGSGTIIPSSGILPFTFEAVNLSAVDIRVIKITEKSIPQFLQINELQECRELKRVGTFVTNKKINLAKNKNIDLKAWHKHTIDLSKLFKAEPGAIYQVALGFRKSYSLYSCNDTIQGDSESMLRLNEDWDEPGYDYGYSYWDYFDQYQENYDDRENPCKKSYYNTDKAIFRNILASNIGLIAKTGSRGSLVVAASDLITTAPLNGTILELYDYHQQLIASGKTENGFAHIITRKKPFLIVAKHGQQRGYLKVDNESSISLSRFDIGGETYNKGVKGFIYTERDVWRPGDSLFINFVMEDLQKSLPAGHPVIMELYNPQQELVRRIVKTKSLDKFYTFHTATDQEAPTGNYTANVIVGGSTFSKTLKIETIIPNRLKIQLDWDKESIKFPNNELKGNLTAQWLHGGIAKNMLCDINLNLAETQTFFSKYQDYTFTDPNRKFLKEKMEVLRDTLDEKGSATFKAKININEVPPGIISASFKTRVYEPGGNFSSEYFNTLLYPYDAFVGIKINEDKYSDALSTEQDNSIHFAAIDANEAPLSGKKIKIQVYKLVWRWWWENASDDDFTYNGKMHSEPVLTDSIISQKGKATWKLKIAHEDWGRYYIKATLENGHSSGKIIYFQSSRWTDRQSSDDPEGTKMLTFNSDKNRYSVGENITLNIPTSFSGNVLLSLESGTKVVKTYWIKALKGNTTFSFPATSDMAPNIYAHATLIQPHAQTKNDLPIRMYGILSIAVENPETHLHPIIKIPEKVKPEEEISIQINERDNKAMTYTIAIVDEGLLDLTRYKTPDIWSAFNQRQALDVKTWDIYDNVAAAEMINFKNILTIGGDGSNGPLDGAKASRFKPVVIFLGPFHCGKGERKLHKVRLPNYIGSVKTMVIAGYEGRYGHAEVKTKVSKPLMILGTLPRKLSPKDEISFPVTVFATDKNIKNVSVQVAVNDQLTLTQASNIEICFAVPGEQLIQFPIKVNNNTGIGKVKVIAKCKGETATYETEIEVKSPNPMIEKVIEKTIAPGETWPLTTSPFGIEGTNEGLFEITSTPPLNLGSRLDYLIHYPYGCVEQTTSGAFPQVYLDNFLNLSKEQKKETEKNIKAAISRLKHFQLADGSLSYWPGLKETNEWGTCYAGHFMLEAETAGYMLPIDFKDRWIKYIKQKSINWTEEAGSPLTQSYRLYLLALNKAPELAAMNRMRVIKLSSSPEICFLAAAYYLTGQQELAKELVKNISIKHSSDQEQSYTFGSDNRDKAILLLCLTTLRHNKKADNLAKEIAQLLNSNTYMSTQESAFALIALAKYAGRGFKDGLLQFTYTQNGSAEKVESRKLIWQKKIKEDKDISTSVINTSQGILYATYISKGIPEPGDEKDLSSNLVMYVSYKSMDGKPINPSSLKQGTDFMATVTIENPGKKGDYQHLALTEIFPSGWEIHNSRIYDEPQYSNSSYTYMDIRDDRVNIFFDLMAKEKKTFTILLNASYEGKFYLPAVYSEAMYDNSISASRRGNWVQVLKKPLEQ